MTDQESLIRPEANAVADSSDCDVLLLNTPIYSTLGHDVAELCVDRTRRRNLLFILATAGGDADAAYRLATVLQDNYERLTCYVAGYCKSAGTLVAIGAHELVMGDFGELGPLDVQLSKEDEIAERRSGLTVLSALKTLHQQAFEAFEHFMLSIKFRSGGSITTRTATEIATDLTGKLMVSIYGHIDVMHLGEAGRSLLIAHKYGELLDRRARNLCSDTLDNLTSSYPVHTFVIDRRQAKNLFNNVRSPSVQEMALAKRLDAMAMFPCDSSNKLVAFLNSENQTAHQEKLHHENTAEILGTGGGPPEHPAKNVGTLAGHATGGPQKTSTQAPTGFARENSRDTETSAAVTSERPSRVA